MIMNYQFIKKSSNAKTGAIPVTNSHRDTCPKACPFIRNGCYAHAGYYTRLNWDKITDGSRGVDYTAMLAGIAKLPADTLWRHNVSGDLVGSDNVIDILALSKLVGANKGKKGFTYTHYPMIDKSNRAAVSRANENGFTVNASADCAADAVDIFKAYKLPVVTVLPIDAPEKQTIEGVTIVTCPATYKDNVTCKTCKLCAVSDRQVIVGFPAHGSQAKKANIIASAS